MNHNSACLNVSFLSCLYTILYCVTRYMNTVFLIVNYTKKCLKHNFLNDYFQCFISLLTHTEMQSYNIPHIAKVPVCLIVGTETIMLH